MIHKSLIEKSVFLYICFSFFSWRYHIFLFSIFLKLRTASMSNSTMIKPISKTKPTKFMFTTTTSHMIATLIFLNKDITFWASFCIRFYPKYIFSITIIFYFPLFEHFTSSRPVTFLAASETINIPANTTD
jgi:hypothetical protein